MVGNLTTKLKPNDIIPDLEAEDFFLLVKVRN